MAEPSFQPYLRDIAKALSREELECPTFIDASLGARLALKDDLSVAQVAKVVAGEPLLDLGHFYALWRAAQLPELAARPQEVRSLVHDCHEAVGAFMLQSLKLTEPIILAVREHEDDPAGLAPGSLSQILCLANRCANAPAAQSGDAAGGPAPVSGGGLDELAAQALLAEHFDEVTWLLAAVRG